MECARDTALVKSVSVLPLDYNGADLLPKSCPGTWCSMMNRVIARELMDTLGVNGSMSPMTPELKRVLRFVWLCDESAASRTGRR